MRLVKGGAWLPAVIFRPCPIEMPADGPWQWCDRWPLLAALYDSDSFGNPRQACEPAWVWMSGTEISPLEFKFWIDTRRHIRLYEPDAVDADPRKKIDLSQMAPRGPRKR